MKTTRRNTDPARAAWRRAYSLARTLAHAAQPGPDHLPPVLLAPVWRALRRMRTTAGLRVGYAALFALQRPRA